MLNLRHHPDRTKMFTARRLRKVLVRVIQLSLIWAVGTHTSSRVSHLAMWHWAGSSILCRLKKVCSSIPARFGWFQRGQLPTLIAIGNMDQGAESTQVSSVCTGLGRDDLRHDPWPSRSEFCGISFPWKELHAVRREYCVGVFLQVVHEA